jgi:hypothetical protein
MIIEGSVITATCHTWVEDETARKDNGNGTYGLTFNCACGEELVIADAKLSDDPAKTYDSTCKDEGKKTYVYTDPNTGLEAEFVIPVAKKVDHTVNGVTLTDSAKYEYSAVKALIEAGVLKVVGNVNSTCVEAGYATFDCDFCGQHTMISVHADHDFGAEQVIEATHAAPGKKYKVCKNCDLEVVIETYDVVAHVYGEPTLNAEGKFVFTCTCGDVKVVEAKKVVVKAPTCTAGGYTDYYLNDTEFVRASYTEALGHDYDEKVIVNFQVEINGIMRNCKAILCKVCGEALIIEVEPEIGEGEVELQ